MKYRANASVITSTDCNSTLELHVEQGDNGKGAQHAIVALSLADAKRLSEMLKEAVERLEGRGKA